MNKRLALVAFALQAVAGTPAAAPQYTIGVLSGSKMVDFSAEDKVDEDYIAGVGAATHAYRESVAAAADFGTRALVKSLGALLYGILGSKSVSGAGPYTHIFTMGDTIPMFTVWGKLDSEIRKLQDGKIDELKIAWDLRKPLDVNVTMPGLMPVAPFPASVPAGGTDDRMGTYFKPVGGTFQWDVDGSTLATIALKSATLTFKRNCEASDISAQVTPDAIDEGLLEVEVELKARVTDLTAARTILTGTAAGNTASNEPVYGSFSLGVAAGTHSLVLASTRLPWTTEASESDSKGGPIEATFKGTALVPAGQTTPITATLINDVATYVAA